MKWRNRTRYEPLSMIPANGWQAVYAGRDESDPEKADVFTYAAQLVAFALVKVSKTRVRESGREEVIDNFRAIAGYGRGRILLEPVSRGRGMDNFIGHLAPGESIPDWMEQEARRYVENEAKGD